MMVGIKQYCVDEEHNILNVDVQCEASRKIQAEKFRISLVFEASCGKRYFPVSAQYQKEEGDRRIYTAHVSVELRYVFWEEFPTAQEDVALSAAFCTEEALWTYTDTLLELPGTLFYKVCPPVSFLRRVANTFFYGICTILLPIWLIDGVLAQHGLHRLHPAAAGRQGKSAVFYHAHGLVRDWTGYGYSVREYKTNYYKKCYDRACRKYPETRGILFLSERRLEAGGNLDRIRSEVQKAGYPYREFLTECPIHKLTRSQIRTCAEMTAAAKLIILEDFVPQIHALSIRRETQILQMWHACGAFKLFGLSELGIVDHLKQSTRNHRSYTAVLASSEGVVPFYSEAFGVDEPVVHPIGVPRTDIFFDQGYAAEIRKKLLDKYPVCRDKKVILFAPTFRGSGNKTAYYPWDKFPVAQIMSRLPDDTILILKNHPFVKKKCEIPQEYQNRILDLSVSENINDLLFITSLLITDYSSVIFEASLLEIPMLFYTFDLQEYLKKRDIYFDFASFAPGRITGDLQELEKEIKKMITGEDDGSSDISMAKGQFRKLFLGALDGDSTKRTMELINNCLQQEIDRK